MRRIVLHIALLVLEGRLPRPNPPIGITLFLSVRVSHTVLQLASQRGKATLRVRLEKDGKPYAGNKKNNSPDAR